MIVSLVPWPPSQQEVLAQYDRLLTTATKFGVHVKPSKCYFFSENLELSGHCIPPEGRFSTEKSTEVILSMPCVHSVSSVKRFLSPVDHLRDHVRNMSTRTIHFLFLLQKGTHFIWTSGLTSPDTMLTHPIFSQPFEVHTDASKHVHGVVAMLAQWYKNKLRAVKFPSGSFSPTESRWSTTHQEVFAFK